MITTFRLLGGVMTGGGLLMSYRSLKSVQQGKTVFIAYKQSTILYDLALSTFSLLRDMDLPCPSRGRRPWMARLVAYPLPFALQIIHYNIDDKKHPQIAEAVKTAREHMEHVALAIDVVVSALFTYYVAPYYGVGILIGITIEMLNEEKVLTGKVKDVWEKAWLGLAFSRLFRLALFEDNDLLDLGLFACELATFTYEHYFADSFEQPAPQKAPFDDRIPQVNWSHLLENPNLTIKGAAHLNIVETMEALTKRVEWNKPNLLAFKAHLIKDPRFCDLYSLKIWDDMKAEELQEIAAAIPDDAAIKEFQAGAKLLATQVANMAIQRGDSYIRYEVMQGMLRSILKTMEENFDQNAVADLFQLAVSGGDYCGGGKAETIENVYKRRVLQGKEVPLRVKLLHLLAAMRKRWFDHLYGAVTAPAYRLPKGIFDPADLHFYNISLFYFDKGYKLHCEAIKNDMNISETSFCSRFYRLLLAKFLDYTFWNYALRSPHWYNPKALLDDISVSAGQNGLPLTDFNKWWEEWVKKQDFPAEKKTALLDYIDENTIFDQPITIEVNKEWKVNPKILKLMFYDMGIFK